MAEAADACHKHGMKYKICEFAHLHTWLASRVLTAGCPWAADNTMRELSNRCRELWAMRSFKETYVPGPDPNPDGADWLQEHLNGDCE